MELRSCKKFIRTNYKDQSLIKLKIKNSNITIQGKNGANNKMRLAARSAAGSEKAVSRKKVKIFAK